MVYSIPRTSLKRGAKSNEVFKLQQLLAQRLGSVSITGLFDYETEIAVKTFQSRMFLTPDGIVGPLTWQALWVNAPVEMPTLWQGCHGDTVESVQDLLSIDLYYVGTVDGDFGPKTYAAVQRFQRDFGIPDEGIVDARTWQALSQI
ncbi:MAG: peptidoglycan-binding protein [Cyanobacteria bacterium P01_D01_bin.156]